jgi:type VI secretion system protein VasD
MNRQRLVGHGLILVMAVALAGCGKLLPGGGKPETAAPAPTPPPKPQPPPVNLTLQTSATIKPRESKRPSPVVVRVYQLKNDAAFRTVTYDRLYGDDKAALGDDLIERATSITLRPSEKTVVSIVQTPDLRFIGIAAFYREYAGKQWTVVIPAPLGGDGTVVIDQSSVSFTAK